MRDNRTPDRVVVWSKIDVKKEKGSARRGEGEKEGEGETKSQVELVKLISKLVFGVFNFQDGDRLNNT